MKNKAFHIQVDTTDISALVALLLQHKNPLNLSPVLREARYNLEALLDPVGIGPPLWLLESNHFEILLDGRKENAILLKTTREPAYKALKNGITDILVIAKEDTLNLECFLKDSLSDTVRVGSWNEYCKIDLLDSQAGDLSSNGKLLTDPTQRQASRDLYDDSLRTSSRGKNGESTISRFHKRALQQGLWLESLSSDLMSRFSRKVWTGQYFGPHEIDVLAVFGDYTILVECKDTSYGLNDLYVTISKANDVGAEAVIIVTTRHIHQNVIAKLDDAKAGIAECALIELISKDSSESIASELSNVLTRLEEIFPDKWLRWPTPEFFRGYF